MRRSISVSGLLLSGLLIMLGGFLPWFGNRSALETPARDLVLGLSGGTTSPFGSVAALLGVVAFVAVVAAVGHSALAAWIAAGASALIAVVYGVLQAAHVAPQTFSTNDLQSGLWLVILGSLLAGVSAVVLSGFRQPVDIANFTEVSKAA